MCFVFLTRATEVRAQVSEKNNFEQRSTRTDQQLIQYQQNLQNVKIAVMDGAIDPKEYIVGPGDIYSVNVWSSPPVGVQLAVTPEGSIIFPTVGEVLIEGLHLDEAKKKVISAIRRKYISGEVSFTLLTPRMFAVTVRGVVQNEGTVYLQANERVDAAIALANSSNPKFLKNESADAQKRDVAGNIIANRDTAGSLRKVIIRHKNGSQGTADLEKYFVQKESRYNPLLQDGDIIIVPKQNIDRDYVGVYGAVNVEGVYEFVPGDSLFSMLKIARGLTALADTQQVEVIRSDDTGNFLKTLRPDLKSIVSRKSADFPLQRGDRIVVRENPEMRRDDKVYIEGEVIYPGFYPISKDSTTLSAIVQKAGGFNGRVSLSASQLIRRANSSRDKGREHLENARGGLMQEDSITYKLESEIRMRGELVVTDFVDLFANNDKSKDIYLQNGDRIIIASGRKTVYVFGQVLQPGHIPFVKDQSYKFYVNKAGGFTEDAVKADLRVIKAGSRQWLAPDETSIEEGDYIWVPKEPYRPFGYYMQTYSQVFSIVATLATLAVLVVQLRK
jgi:protein involved in polysaccharide export with SLBB domain